MKVDDNFRLELELYLKRDLRECDFHDVCSFSDLSDLDLKEIRIVSKFNSSTAIKYIMLKFKFTLPLMAAVSFHEHVVRNEMPVDEWVKMYGQ